MAAWPTEADAEFRVPPIEVAVLREDQTLYAAEAHQQQAQMATQELRALMRKVSCKRYGPHGRPRKEEQTPEYLHVQEVSRWAGRSPAGSTLNRVRAEWWAGNAVYTWAWESRSRILEQCENLERSPGTELNAWLPNNISRSHFPPRLYELEICSMARGASESCPRLADYDYGYRRLTCGIYILAEAKP